MKMLENIKIVYNSTNDDNLDSGDIVQYVIITAFVAVLAFAVMKWVGTATQNKGADLSQCIESSNAISSNASNDCDNINHAKDNSFTKDQGYTKRFGG